MNVGVTPAQSSAGPVAVSAASPRRHLRLALLGVGGVLLLLGTLLVTYELALVRVPQHRAALEELIRHETGLEVTFSELSVRWGWYGPEAVFHSVTLAEPGARRALLTAPRLRVGLDAWRMVRSGQLEAGRITLQNPDIDLDAVAAAGPHAAAALPLPAAQGEVFGAGMRLLSRWRGGQIDIEGGTLRALPPGANAPLALGISHARVRRLGWEWNADALVLLPESLGASARLALQMHGDPALPERLSGTLSVDGRRLESAGWRILAHSALTDRYLPRAGRGNLEARLVFAHARVLSAQGKVRAEALEWASALESQQGLALEHLSGQWQLARAGGAWHLSVAALQLGAAPATGATLTLEAAADGAWARGRVQHAPLSALALVAHWYAPQLPLADIALDGQARELQFDWNAARAAGARLVTSLDVQDLALADAAREVTLSGLSGHLFGTDAALVADLQAQGAHLTLARTQPVNLDQLQISTRLALESGAGGWQLRTDDLEVRRGDMRLAASGTIGVGAAGARPLIDAHLAAKDADVALLAGVLGPEALAPLGAAAQLSAGRIESADLAWRGALAAQSAWSGTDAEFAGAVTLRDAKLRATEVWPQTSGIEARIDWRGGRGHAAINGANSGSFRLSAASADWDTRSGRTHFAGHLQGEVREALGWLREHPALASDAPGLAEVDLRGDTLIDVDVTLPPATALRAPAAPRVRIAALLDGAQLRALAGLPPIDALHGTLALAGGHLARSTLTGTWLGGPVSLSVGEHRERGASVLTILGHGELDARESVRAAGGSPADAPLAGNAEWSALLSLLPGEDPHGARWQLRADSNLVGVASHLPEPFAKAASAALPLHVELSGDRRAGQLQLALGERLHALAALERSGDSWRIERGALRLAAGAPALPEQAVLEVDGRLNQLDLAAYLALVQLAGRDAALPVLRAQLYAGVLLAGSRSYPDASVIAVASERGGELQLQSAGLSGTLRWPAQIDAQHPALVHLAGFDIAQPADAALGAGLAAALAPAARLSVDELTWQGRTLGRFAALLSSHEEVLDGSELELSGASGTARGRVHCEGPACSLSFSLESLDAAATLTAFGLRPDLSASRANLAGELHWVPQAPVPLATLGGHLHMQLDEGMTRVAQAPAMPFALLSVPALLAGLSGQGTSEAATPLRFTRLAADFELSDGNASTTDLYFDGDAEILVRGQVGLEAGDYDEQAWILRGEDRLPAALRRLGPMPRVAAAWLSLRELFSATPAERTHTALRLRGTWNDPIVTPAE
jgi:uncharacterized protein YhdP